MVGIGTEVAIYCPSKDDAGNGTGTLTELTGLHTNGTITGATWVVDTDEGGVRALSFDGTNDKVAIGNIGFGSDPWSVGLWVKFTDFSDYAPLVVFTSATENYQPGIYGNTQNSGDSLGSWWESVDPDFGYDSTGTFVANTWYHVGVSYGSDGLMRYYIDGVAKGTTNWGVGVSTGNTTVYLGHGPASNYGNLRLDDIRFFDSQIPIGDFVTLSTSRGEGLSDSVVLEVTEDDDTLSSTASILVGGSLTATEADDTLSSTASNFANTGSLAVTEVADTLESSVGASLTGSLTVTEADDTLAATGTAFPVFGTVNINEADDTLVSDVTMLITGVLEVTEENDILATYSSSAKKRPGFFVSGFFVQSKQPNSMFLGV